MLSRSCPEFRRSCLALTFLATFVPLAVRGQAAASHQHDSAPSTAVSPRLGTVRFTTSAPAGAQAKFIEGLLFLHSFEYESARAAFREAERRAPGFAMAHWGEAQTHNHPVWNQQEPDSARAALARLAPSVTARARKALTSREKAWLETVEVLYGEGSKPRRDTLYLRAMTRLAAAYPADDEAQSFLALAWLGLNQAERRVSDYMRAGSIAAPVFARNPDHPGAAHYVIHSFDDPEHAVLGLPAARAYSRIAPGAAHAQHMTTHIFLALGMWTESNAQNRIALDAVKGVSGHYGEWLVYGLVQQGRFREANALLDSLTARSSGRRSLAMALPMMRAEVAVAAGDWSQGRSALLQASMSNSGVAAVISRMAESADLVARGDTASGLALLRRAQAAVDSMPVDFGPPATPLLVGEQLGAALLASGRAGEAQRVIQASLRRAPGRSSTLALLVRAAVANGDDVVADEARATLAGNWVHADDGGAALRALPARRTASK